MSGASSLPIDPTALAGLEPVERGKLYNGIDLDPSQRQCVEAALRMVEAGSYPPSPAAAADHLRRERETREGLGRPREA